jgi:hypothetical protein
MPNREERLRQRLERIMSAELQANFDALQGEHAQAIADIANLQRLVQAATDAAEAARLAASNATATATAAAATATATATAAAATPAASATETTFSANPFNGNINPTNSNGLKLYQAGTASRPDTSKVTATITKSKAFLDAMRDDATKFGWGMLISNIGPDNLQILHDFKGITLKMVRLSMNPIFYSRTNNTTVPPEKKPDMFDIDPSTQPLDKIIFFNRVRANMIGQRIYNSLDSTSLASLKLKENLYLWKTASGEEFYDGVTMLQILVEKVKPSTRVGRVALKDKIRNSKLANFNHNVCDMLDHMNDNYNEIIRSGGSHEDMVMDLYSALLTSKNDIFNSFIQRSKDDWETKQDISIEELTTLATEKFNNMSEQRQWDSSASKSDSSKIVALATQVEELQKKLSHAKGKPEVPKKPTPFLEVAEWRKTKSFGPSVTKDGRDWHWCSIKHNNGKGMYVTHREEDHGNFRRNKPKDSTTADTKSKDQTNKTMTLSDNLKAAMVSKFKCSSEEAERLWSDVAKGNNSDF